MESTEYRVQDMAVQDVLLCMHSMSDPVKIILVCALTV